MSQFLTKDKLVNKMGKTKKYDTDIGYYEDYKKRKHRKQSREEFLDRFVQCPQCGYRNKKVFLERTGCCNCCNKILDPRAHMKYVVNRKIKFYNKNI